MTAAGAGAQAPAPAWRTPAGAAAVVVLAGSLLWRIAVLARGYFGQEDFLLMSAGKAGSWRTAFGPDAVGGFAPGASLLARLQVSYAPLDWTVSVVVVSAFVLASGVLVWLVLTRLLGDRWIRVPLLTLFCVSTLTLWSAQWWAVALQFWPSTCLLLLALWAVLKAVQDADARYQLLAAASVVAALLFNERAVLDPVLLAGAALLSVPGRGIRDRIVTAARSLAPLWIALLVIVGGYVVLRWIVAPVPLVAGSDLGDVVTNYLRHSLALTFGGPWTGSLPAHAYLIPKSWTIALNGLLLLTLAGVTIQRGGPRAVLAWGALVGFVGASVGLLVLLGSADMLRSLGLVHRFSADFAVPLVLCLGGALADVPVPRPVWRGRRLGATTVEVVASLLVAALVTASAAVSTAFLAPDLFHRQAREYVGQVRAELRDHPRVVVLNGRVPSGVLSDWFGDRATVEAVVGVAPENPVFDLPSSQLRMVRYDGLLTEVALTGETRALPSENKACGYPVRADGTTIPLGSAVPRGRWVARVGYYSGRSGYATLRGGDGPVRFPVLDGLNVIDVPLRGPFDALVATFEDAGGTVCVTNVSVGVPGPSGGYGEPPSGRDGAGQ